MGKIDKSVSRYQNFNQWQCVLLSRFTDRFHIYEFWYNFDTVLYQFLETGTSDRTLIGRDQLLKCSGFSVFLLYDPVNKDLIEFIIVPLRKYLNALLSLKRNLFDLKRH